jgi:hypothetical protein
MFGYESLISFYLSDLYKNSKKFEHMYTFEDPRIKFYKNKEEKILLKVQEKYFTSNTSCKFLV